MAIPTEPIGSIPRPQRLIEAIATTDGVNPALDSLYDEVIRDTIAQLALSRFSADYAERIGGR